MPEDEMDNLEFTAEEMRAALKDVGQTARQEAFAAGLPVYIIRGTSIVALHADGTEEIVAPLHKQPEANGKPK